MVCISLRKIVVSTLAAAMVLGSGTAVLAKDSSSDNSKKDWDDKKIKIEYRDMQGEDFRWALRYIADLAGRRIFEGYSDGTFRPQATVSRIEAITAAVRLMGLREVAESPAKMSVKLNFKDANQVPAWAVGYVAVALENDLFGESDTMVFPNQPGDRLWAATLMVKALKLTAEAEAKMNVKLNFADADKIPAGSVGYVAVAVERGLVNGFEDRTFRPNQPVTRAQIAALLDRAGEHLPGSNEGVAIGTLTQPVTNNVLTLNQGGQIINLTLDEDTFIFRAGVRVSASALQVGDVVKTRSTHGYVFLVDANPYNTIPAPYPTPNPIPISGTTTGTLVSAVSNNTLMLVNSGQVVNLPVHANALYFRNGTQVAANSLQVGDVLSARSINNVIVLVTVTQTAGSQVTLPSLEKQVTGTVAKQVENNVLMLSSGGQLTGLTVNENAFIYSGGLKISASALKVGDVITITSYSNVAAIIEMKQTAIQLGGTGTVTGTVAAPVMGGNKLAITSGGSNFSLNLGTNVMISRGGVQTSPSALQVGDVLRVHYYDSAVIYAEVTQLASS